MQASDSGRIGSTKLLIACVVTASLVGLVVSWFDPVWAIAGLGGLVAVGLVLYDYRIGAICLTFLLPWLSSPLIPQTHGFNLVNFLILASVASLALRRTYQSEPRLRMPRVVLYCYLLPIAIATLLAIPHLPQAVANFPPRAPEFVQAFALDEYLKARVMKPMYYVIYAYVLASAVKESKRPEQFLVAFGLSAVIPALTIIGSVLMGAGSVFERGGYLENLGLHPNSYGMMLALASGPLLFLATGSGPKFSRLASVCALALVSVGLLLTGSRGATLAYLVILAVWVIRRRRFSDLLFLIAFVVLMVIAVPDKVFDRLTLGLDDTQATRVDNMDDPLTKGRIASWALLGPDILDSPLWGRGLGSVAWNTATTAGRYEAALSHNMYLDVLLDMGLLGFVAFSVLFYRYIRGFSALSRNPTISPRLQEFFGGAFAAILGMLAMSATNGYYMPVPEQTFLWFGLALLYAYWPLFEAERAAKRSKRGVRPGKLLA